MAGITWMVVPFTTDAHIIYGLEECVQKAGKLEDRAGSEAPKESFRQY